MIRRVVTPVHLLFIVISFVAYAGCRAPEGFFRFFDSGVGPEGTGGFTGSGGDAIIGSGGNGTGGGIIGSGGQGTGGTPGSGGVVGSGGRGTGGRGSGGASSGGMTGGGGRGGRGGGGAGGDAGAGGDGGGGSGTGGAPPTCTGCQLDVMLTPGSNGSNTLAGTILVTNKGGTIPMIADVSVKYWFTSMGEVADPLIVELDDVRTTGNSSMDIKSLITSAVTHPTPARTRADSVLTFTFSSTATLQLIEATPLKIQFRAHRTDYVGTFNVTNDYSYAAMPPNPWPNVTVYVKGALAGGVEPTATQ